ncbi:MAG: NAD(P)-binding domain-containing protein [Rhodobacteraceae bacterium]|nr:NAD(P)-binding domain-containing protein [Paracoccaceae bacterium]
MVPRHNHRSCAVLGDDAWTDAAVCATSTRARFDFSPLVIFVVPESGQIDEVLGAMLAKAGPDLIIWDFTTSEPVHTMRLAARAADAGIPYMDAGMTGGGAKGADESTMTLMIGGDPDDRR